MLLPLGPPLPDDSVSVVRGESGMLGGLSVPLKWGVAVPPDDYDHWAPKPEVSADTGDAAADAPAGGSRTPLNSASGTNGSGGKAKSNPTSRCRAAEA